MKEPRRKETAGPSGFALGAVLGRKRSAGEA